MLFKLILIAVYSQFRGSEKVLTDNGTEFKNKLINEVCEQLGVKHKIYLHYHIDHSPMEG